MPFEWAHFEADLWASVSIKVSIKVKSFPVRSIDDDKGSSGSWARRQGSGKRMLGRIRGKHERKHGLA